MGVQKCTQESLDAKGLNTTCVSDEEMNRAIDGSYLIINVMYEYFDQKDYSDNPIKRQSSVLYYNVASNYATA